jgi:thiamine biosynthesis protein ThiS
MNILLNGNPVTLDETTPTTLEKFLNTQNLPALMYAVALNGEHIPKHLYGQYTLVDQDEVEIVVPVQGG